jgi:hypothetical protein
MTTMITEVYTALKSAGAPEFDDLIRVLHFLKTEEIEVGKL